MSFESLLVHSVTISNPVDTGSVNEYGDAVPGTPSTAVEDARIQPARRLDFFVEELRNRDTRVARFVIYCKPTSIITGLSTVTWGSRVFRVVSTPATVWDSDTFHHYEALMEEILG